MKIVLVGPEAEEYLNWRCSRRPVRLELTVTDTLTGEPLPIGENGMFQQPVDKSATITATFKDQFGNTCPTPAGVTLVWVGSDPILATVSAAADTLSAVHKTVAGVLGSDRVSVSGGGFSGSVDIQFIPGTPVSLNLSVGNLQPM